MLLASAEAGIAISGFDTYLPEGRIEISSLVEQGHLSEDQYRRIGVRSVPVAAPEEHSSDLMIKAGRRLLERLDVAPGSVDFVITASVVPAEYLMRTLAGRVCHELGAVNANGFDLYQGCNAFVMQLELAVALLATRPSCQNVLLVAGDRWQEYSDHRVATNMVFGDAGAAALVSRSGGGIRPVAVDSLLDGSLHDLAGVAFGSRAFADRGGGPANLDYAVCDRQKLASTFIPGNLARFQRVAERVLASAGLGTGDVAALHVPSGRDDVMRKLISTLGFDLSRTNHPYLAEHGDLSSVGPYADLARLCDEPFANPGDIILSLTQGAAMVWSGLILRR
ncbi:MAG: hypothetical protein JXA67_08880 [Micromonosporaceae bacterium]|nr:hypothetical protein [Micromonosporaceae bacterium]